MSPKTPNGADLQDNKNRHKQAVAARHCVRLNRWSVRPSAYRRTCSQMRKLSLNRRHNWFGQLLSMRTMTNPKQPEPAKKISKNLRAMNGESTSDKTDDAKRLRRRTRKDVFKIIASTPVVEQAWTGCPSFSLFQLSWQNERETYCSRELRCYPCIGRYQERVAVPCTMIFLALREQHEAWSRSESKWQPERLLISLWQQREGRSSRTHKA